VTEEPPGVPEVRIADARDSGTWGSALTTGEFAAIRSVGFEPVGQVYGAAVYAARSANWYSCPGTQTQVSGRSGSGASGRLVQATYQARRAAIDRMVAECTGLGGHGVVGVRLFRGSFRLGGVEFTAIGTAVRAAAAHRQQPPFTSDVSGQDFAKLITNGWVPAGLALGISIGSRHDDWATTRQTRWRSGNVEVAGWTELVNESRHDARSQLESDVHLLGAEGVVIAAMLMQVRERDCPTTVGRRDHVVEATLIGTAITRFSRTGQRPAGPSLAVMSLGPRRRQVARVWI
jgi:uncharacterized protein YbjQ (UPF0145 family)